MATITPVKAIHGIDFKIEPGTIFTPDTQEQRDELLALGAVAELDEIEARLFVAEAKAEPAKPAKGKPAAADDPIS